MHNRKIIICDRQKNTNEHKMGTINSLNVFMEQNEINDV